MNPMRKGIYAIIDNLTGETFGGLYLHIHEATALRFFTDVMTTQDSQVKRHHKDYTFNRLGYINGTTIEPDPMVMISATQWLSLNAGDDDTTPVAQPNHNQR